MEPTTSGSNMSQSCHPISCDECRKSHIRCDRILPQCSHCQRRNKQCTYRTPKRNRHPTTTTTTTTTHSSSVISSHDHSIDDQQTSADNLLADYNIENRSKRPKQHIQSTASSSSSSSPPFALCSEVSFSTVSIVDNFNNMSVPFKSIFQFYLAEISGFWSFLPRSILQAMTKSVSTFSDSPNFCYNWLGSSSRIYEEEQIPDNTYGEEETFFLNNHFFFNPTSSTAEEIRDGYGPDNMSDGTISDILSNQGGQLLKQAIVSLTLCMLPLSYFHCSNGSDQKQMKAHVRHVARSMQKSCESFLLQDQVFGRISEDVHLVSTACVITAYFLCFEEQVDKARVWMSTIKSFVNNSSVVKDEERVAMELHYLTMKWIAINNCSAYDKSSNWRQMHKRVKLLCKMMDLYSVGEVPSFIEDVLPPLKKYMKVSAQTNQFTMSDMRSVYNLVMPTIIYNNPSLAKSLKENYRPNETFNGKDMIDMVSWDLTMLGFMMDVILSFEEQVKGVGSNLEEIQSMKLVIANRITTCILSSSSVFFIHGIFQLRPLVQAAMIHTNMAQQSSINNNIDSILPYLQSDLWLLESLQEKYHLTRAVINITQQLREQANSLYLLIQLRPPLLNIDSSDLVSSFSNSTTHSDVHSFLDEIVESATELDEMKEFDSLL